MNPRLDLLKWWLALVLCAALMVWGVVQIILAMLKWGVYGG